MPRVRPFSALRYVDDVAGRFTWSATPSPSHGATPLHSSALLTALDAPAVLKTWAAQGQLVSETPGFYVVETQALSPRPGRASVPARFLVGVVEGDDALLPFEEEAPALGATAAHVSVTPMLAADDQQALEETLAVAAQPPPRGEFESDGRRVRMWKVEEAGALRRVEDLLSEMIIRPLAELPKGKQALAAIAPVSSEALDLRPVHRGLAHLPTFNVERFLAVVKDYARIYELDGPIDTPAGLEAARAKMAALATRSHAVMLVLPHGQGRILRFRQDLDLGHLKAAPRNPTLRSLDLALLESVVFQTVLGLKDPASPAHPNIFPVTTAPKIVEQVNAGLFQVGFALNPPPRWELRAVMEASQLLPPRTLYVDGAPPAGLLFLAP